MNPPGTIPTPLAERWREFKRQVLPGIVFAAAVLAAGLLWRNYVTPVSLVGRVETVQASVASPKPGSLTQLLEPTTNMTVQVRTRGAVRQVGLGRILAVGAHLRPIHEELMAPVKNEPLEVGLPIAVSLPQKLKAHPGELVDLTILERIKADPP